MQCDRCAGETFTKAGRDRLGRQLWRCEACSRRLTARSASAFSGYLDLAIRGYFHLATTGYLRMATGTCPRYLPHARFDVAW